MEMTEEQLLQVLANSNVFYELESKDNRNTYSIDVDNDNSWEIKVYLSDGEIYNIQVVY